MLSPLEELQKQIEFEKLQKKTTKSAKEFQKTFEKQVPEAIRFIVEKATANYWEDRYTTVQELSEDLQRYYKNLKVSVKEYRFLELAKMWAKRNKQMLVLLSVSLALLSGSLFSFWQYLSWKTMEEMKINFENAEKKVKMKELLEEGNRYFLKENRTGALEDFYQMILKVIGYMENTSIRNILLESLEQLAEKESKKNGVDSISRRDYVDIIEETRNN